MMLSAQFQLTLLYHFIQVNSWHRVNISNANVFGLSQELKLTTGNKFNNALVIFFVPYILFEIPSNMIMKKLKPHVWRT